MSLHTVLEQVQREVASSIGKGRVAAYIPALARVDPRKFALAAVGIDGETASVGDAAERFSIQSVSKVFSLTLALAKVGDALWRRVGREPSGSSFNSIVQLEHEHGKPRNPLINAGAIAVTDTLLAGRGAEEAANEVLEFVRTLAADPSIEIDAEVRSSEDATGFRNRSLAYFMRDFGKLAGPVEDTLAAYYGHCSIAMSCEQLARAGLFLAAGGRDPISGRRVVTARRARRIAAIMLTCGHYDASGDFAYRVGLPGKSGVGGGILAVAPGHASIAVWSPGLNAAGNSLVGTLALERLAAITGWSVF